MRGTFDPQSVLFVAAIDLEDRIRPDHPLRAVKRMVDDELCRMSKRFDAAYASEGRPSVPPERLIKAMLLQAIYSIRSEAQLVERIDHDLLFRWFLDLRIDEPMFDATVFSHNRARLEKHDLPTRRSKASSPKVRRPRTKRTATTTTASRAAMPRSTFTVKSDPTKHMPRPPIPMRS